MIFPEAGYVCLDKPDEIQQSDQEYRIFLGIQWNVAKQCIYAETYRPA
jgi:hypothetical protein